MTLNMAFIAQIIFFVPSVAYAQGVPNQQLKKTTRVYVPLDSSNHLVINDGEKGLITTDYLSSTRILNLGSSSNVENMNYLPYGDFQQDIDSDNQVTDRFFTSHRKLQDVSLYHAGARMYSPTLGLFIQPDRAAGFNNKYAYAGNNPILMNDPDGNFVFLAALAIVGIAGFLMTTPIKDSPAYPNPQFDENVAHWQATGGPRESMSLLRLNPIAGFAFATSELATGRDTISGEQLNLGDKVLNTVEVAALAIGPLDEGIGLLNKVRNQARVAKYPGGAALLATKSADEAEAAIKAAVPNIRFGVDPKAAGGAYYRPSTVEINYRSKFQRTTSLAQHEGVHALQYENNLKGVKRASYGYSPGGYFRNRMLPIRSASSLNVAKHRAMYNLRETGRAIRGINPRSSIRNFTSDLDMEMMAYASTNTGNRFSAQLSGTLWSTYHMTNPGLVKAGKYIKSTSSVSGEFGIGVGHIQQLIWASATHDYQ